MVYDVQGIRVVYIRVIVYDLCPDVEFCLGTRSTDTDASSIDSQSKGWRSARVAHPSNSITGPEKATSTTISEDDLGDIVSGLESSTCISGTRIDI